jgi:membrane protease YdiL (CAAX protease family)
MYGRISAIHIEATGMTLVEHPRDHSTRLPLWLGSILAGVLVAIVVANAWPLLLLTVGVPLAAIVEAAFLAAFVWWAKGGGPPRALQAPRVRAFRSVRLPSRQWLWGLIAALSFAVTVHAAIVLLFRLIPYPTADFRRGYDLSSVPSQGMQWLAVVISAASAAICEETGFRGFLQQPIESRYNVSAAVLTSSLFFMALHFTKSWALLGMVPIVFGAGVLLGMIAWSSQSLIPPMIGHFVMDVGLFAYWWAGIAGNFSQRPIAESGVDGPFLIACCVFATSLAIVLIAIFKLFQDRTAFRN